MLRSGFIRNGRPYMCQRCIGWLWSDTEFSWAKGRKAEEAQNGQSTLHWAGVGVQVIQVIRDGGERAAAAEPCRVRRYTCRAVYQLGISYCNETNLLLRTQRYFRFLCCATLTESDSSFLPWSAANNMCVSLIRCGLDFGMKQCYLWTTTCFWCRKIRLNEFIETT